MTPKWVPGDLFAEMYGTYTPRLCVDTIVIGPTDTVEVIPSEGCIQRFKIAGPHGVALAQRDIIPGIGTWHLPGGTLYRGERVTEASKRLIKVELGIEIDILGTLPCIESPEEETGVELHGKMSSVVLDNISVVVLARAKTSKLRGGKDGKNVGWFNSTPPQPHPHQIPYLLKHGFLTS